MAAVGRPRVLDEVKRGQVAALVAVGCGIATVASYVGVSVSTIRREIHRNPTFENQIRGAELHARLDPLHAMRRAAATHWRAAAWLLERTQPKEFGRKPPGCYGPEEFRRVMEQVIQTAAEEIDEPKLRRQIVEGLRAAVKKAKRPGADKKPTAAPPPLDEQALARFLDMQDERIFQEADRQERLARRSLRRGAPATTAEQCSADAA